MSWSLFQHCFHTSGLKNGLEKGCCQLWSGGRIECEKRKGLYKTEFHYTLVRWRAMQIQRFWEHISPLESLWSDGWPCRSTALNNEHSSKTILCQQHMLTSLMSSLQKFKRWRMHTLCLLVNIFFIIIFRGVWIFIKGMERKEWGPEFNFQYEVLCRSSNWKLNLGHREHLRAVTKP